MRRLGKADPRQLDSFGVSGLLLEGCHVLASAVFGTADAGRISDLILARIRGTGMDEMRARVLLLYAIFEAYHCQLDLAMKGRVEGEPILLECGYDEEKVAIAISFRSQHKAADFEGTSERVAAYEPKDHFESLLCDIHRHADRVVVRNLPGQRTEVVSLFAIDPALAHADQADQATETAEGAEPAEVSGGKPAPVIHVFNVPGDVKPTPQAADVVDLGDLDYAEMLAEMRSSAIAAAKASFEKRIAAGERDAEGALTKVAGNGQGGAAGADKITVKGGANGPAGRPMQLKVPGSTDPAAGVSDAVVVSGAPAAPLSDDDPRVQAYVTRINELASRLKQLEASNKAAAVARRAADSRAAVAGGKGDDELAGLSEAERAAVQARKKLQLQLPGVEVDLNLQQLLSKIWPFKKGAKGDEKPAADATAGPAAPVAPGAEAAPEQTVPAEIDEAIDDAEPENDELVREIKQGQMAQALSKATTELDEIRKEASPRAQKWMEGLVGDLVSEKARLSDVAKKYNLQVRKKEIEIRRRESTLQNQISKKNEELRQKDNAIMHFKEQLATVTRKLDAAKVVKKTSDDGEIFKQKYHETQRQLANSKDEASKLQKKMNDLKAQISTLQANLRAKSAAPANSAETAGLKSNYEKVQRQAEELRDANARLQAQLAEANEKMKGTAEPPAKTDDAKRLSAMLEQASKNLIRVQRDADTQKKQKGDLEKENARLKMEMKQLRLALNQAQAKAAGPVKPSGKPGGSKAA